MIFIKSKYLLIGNPIKQSLSPLIHNTFFEDFEKNMIYELMEIDKLTKSLVDTFFEEKIKGINITIPFKQDIMEHLIDIDYYAKKIGAVNTLKYNDKGYVGYNTDLYGMEYALMENEISIKGKDILILGAGGSGYTASFMAVKNCAKTLHIANRTISRANILKSNIERDFDLEIHTHILDNLEKIKNVDIIINTTSLGFEQNINKSPIQKAFLKNRQIEFIFDIIYNPKETKLLKLAKKNDINCINGFSMLVYQALKAQEIWQDEHIDMGYKNSLKDRLLREVKNI